MKMTISLIIPLLVGGLLGLFYFVGLWQTVRRLPGARRPYQLLLWSYVGRLAVALGGFYFFMDSAWDHLAAAVLGFLMVRTLLVRGLGRSPGPPKGATVWKL